MPPSVKATGNYAFSRCMLLTTVDLSDEGLEVIGDAAFDGCESRHGIAIPSSVKVIGNYAFRYCSHMTTVDLCDVGLWAIGKGTFDGCTLLHGISERIARIKERRQKLMIELEERTYFNKKCAVCMCSFLVGICVCAKYVQDRSKVGIASVHCARW